MARKPIRKGKRPPSPISEAFSKAKAETGPATTPTRRRIAGRKAVGEGQKRSWPRKKGMQLLKKYGFDVREAMKHTENPRILAYLESRILKERRAAFEKIATEALERTTWGDYGEAIRALKSQGQHEAANILRERERAERKRL